MNVKISVFVIFVEAIIYLLRLRETHNALQLPVFFFFSFFCWPYPEYRGIRRKKLFYKPLNS